METWDCVGVRYPLFVDIVSLGLFEDLLSEGTAIQLELDQALQPSRSSGGFALLFSLSQ